MYVGTLCQKGWMKKIIFKIDLEYMARVLNRLIKHEEK